MRVGTSVGVLVGETVRVLVGAGEGTGTVVGLVDGPRVGKSLSATVGLPDGTSLG